VVGDKELRQLLDVRLHEAGGAFETVRLASHPRIAIEHAVEPSMVAVVVTMQSFVQILSLLGSVEAATGGRHQAAASVSSSSLGIAI
jgi:hypothetical protein